MKNKSSKVKEYIMESKCMSFTVFNDYHNHCVWMKFIVYIVMAVFFLNFGLCIWPVSHCNKYINCDRCFCSYSPPVSPLSLWQNVLWQSFYWWLKRQWNKSLLTLELWQNYLNHFLRGGRGWCAGVSTHQVFDGQLTAVAKQTLQISILWRAVIDNHQFLRLI